MPVKQYHLLDLDEDIELFPGIEFISLPGHTSGSSGLIIHLERDGVFIFAILTAKYLGRQQELPGLFMTVLLFLSQLRKLELWQKNTRDKLCFPMTWKYLKQ
jgi:glyoxylase-like metal-dependent hydrolase (beta-lactamase superfamily II)